MEHLAECTAMLEQLKLDHPIPDTVRFKSEFQSGPHLKGRSKDVYGFASQIGPTLRVQQATIYVAIGRPLAACLTTLAHEYWHVVQFQVNGQGAGGCVSRNHASEIEAREFAAAYTKEYMTKKCLT